MMTRHVLTSKTFPDKNFYIKRVKEIDHIWVEQVIKLLEKTTDKSKYSLNDIGCNLFQFYKGIRRLRLEKKYKYRGYDIDDFYLKSGIQIFKELKKKFTQLDIEKEKPRSADISIVSALLEHTNKYEIALKNVLESTNQILILRTFLGKDRRLVYKNKKEKIKGYWINEYSIKKIQGLLISENFSIIKIFEDRATKGKMHEVYPKIKRKFSIILAKKI